MITNSWISKFNSILESNIADKPGTSEYARERNGKDDQIHVVVVDDKGSSQELLVKFLRRTYSYQKEKILEIKIQ